MQNLLKIGILLSFIYDTIQQACKLRNTEYNLLNIQMGESMRLPLNEYFTGQGLQYVITNSKQFSVSNGEFGSGTLNQQTPIDITTMNLNNNPNIQTMQYYALMQTQNNNPYSIFSSSSNTGNITSIDFTNNLFTINGSVNYPVSVSTCYQINSLQQNLLITCAQSQTNNLYYLLYTTNGVLLGQYASTITIPTIAQVTTVTVGNNVATMINNGTVVINTNSTGFITSETYTNKFTYIGAFNMILTAFGLQTTEYSITQTVKSNGNDFYTGISLQENGFLFYSTYETGVNIVPLTNNLVNTPTQIFNPFTQGTIGLSTFNFDYSQNYYYVVIAGSQGIVTFIYNSQQSNTLTSEQVFYTEQIQISNMFQTQLFLNARYIVVSNNNGISVYPSIINDINEGQLLYYYNYNIVASGFDYYNNIMIAVNSTNSISFQFNNPILKSAPFSIAQKVTQEQNLTITATPSYYYNPNEDNKIPDFTPCQVMVFYYQIVDSTNAPYINTTYFQNFSNTGYTQQGQQYDIDFGSLQFVNINKMLIGPAISISSPSTKPAISKEYVYTNVLQTPEIINQFGINQNIIPGQQIIYSQIFYNPTFLLNENNNQDSYYQLVQVQEYIVLYECQGLKNTPCQQIAYIKQNHTQVEQFALSFVGQTIYIAYYYNNITDRTPTSGFVSLYQLNPPYNTNQQYVAYSLNKTQVKEDTSILQIALINENLYVLFQGVYGTKQAQLQQYLIAQNVQNINFTSTTPTYQPIQCVFTTQDLFIQGFTYNVPAYGNILFLNTYTVSEVQITNPDQTVINTYNYTYYLTTVNCNGGSFIEISSFIMSYNLGTYYQYMYQLTLDGLYVIQNSQDQLNQPQVSVTFYPRVDLIPAIFIVNNYNQRPKLPIQGVSINTYSITNVVSAASSARFLYLTVQTQQSYTYQIYVYTNSQSLLNSLYYIIYSTQSDIIQAGTISVVSAIQYDGILYRSQGSGGYRNAYLLPEYGFVVKCNLASNAQYQVTYNYVGLKAASLLSSPSVPSNANEYWISFQITNKVSFVKELNTIVTTINGQSLTLNSLGQAAIDPRNVFIGNAQGYQLIPTQVGTDYYSFSLITPVVSYPQTTNYMYPVTAVSAMMTIGGIFSNTSKETYNVSSSRNTQWFTFVQTNRLVYVTPYIYYNPPTDFVKNSTILIDYPLIYKLPVLDIGPNSQNCPLIFVEQNTQYVVSVCGTKVNGKFLASFTLFNTSSQTIVETQVINMASAFPNQKNTQSDNANYELLSGTYLPIGVVVLQYRYSYNFGSTPPTDVVFSFVYTATNDSSKPQMMYGTNTTAQYFQLIQPIDQVFFIPNQNIANLFTVTVFQVTNQFLGFTTSTESTATGSATTTTQTPFSFGLICVSNSDEECLSNSPFTNGTTSSGVIIQVTGGPQLTYIQNVTNGNISIYYNSSNPVITSATNTPFSISLMDALSMKTSYPIQQLVSAGAPKYEFNNAISTVPFIAVSKGTGYVIKMQFYLSNGQYIQSQYACSLMGLTDQNLMLQVSAGGNADAYQVVAVVQNPTLSVNNQVTLLNYGVINNQCNGLSTNSNNQNDNQVTSIGSFTYSSVEATPVLQLMLPPAPLTGQAQYLIPRTLISNNQVIQLLDTSQLLIFQAYPNYTIQGGVTLNYTLNQTDAPSLQAEVSAQYVNTYIQNNLIKGGTGSSLFQFSMTQTPYFGDKVWSRKIWGQFIWGSIMFVIIVGALLYLFSKSRPQAYNSL